MRRFLKLLTVVFTSILIFILLLSVSIKLFEDDIAKAALKQVSKSIDAPVEIGSVNFNLIRGFPKSTIEFSDLWLKSPEANSTDTIAGIHRLYVSVNSRAAMKGRYEVEKIEIDGLALNYIIDPDSLSNIDFLMSLIPTDSTSEVLAADSISDSTTLYLKLEQLLLKNISCSYFDGTSNTGATIQVPEILMEGNIMGNDYSAKTNGKVTITNVNFGDYKLELMQKASLDFNLQYIQDSVQINDFSFQSDGVNLNATGFANIGNNINIDAAIKEGHIDLGILSKYIPREMMNEMGLISAQGILAFNTTITGSYNDSTMPRVDADFSFENGAIKTTDYPEIKHFSLAGKASNGALRNNATTSLDLSSLKVATKNSSITLKAHILNIDQPIYSFESSGALLIDEFIDYIPEGTVESISGHIKWKMGSSGEMPKEIGDDFPDYLMARTWANISVQHLSTTVDSSLTIENLSTDLAYTPEHFSIQNLNIGLPAYDITLKNTSADITLTGSINDVDNMSCSINDSHLEFDNNTLDLKASVSNLIHPDYTFDADITLDLSDLQKMVPDTLVRAMSGIVNGYLSSQGTVDLDSIATQGTALAFENSRLALTCDDVNIKMADTLIDLT
ncbi:MAG: AsmA family protein, partial [Bacteroidales bacterium]|nr:AsmA family protein [Bacteroidales bacterium]